MRKGVFLLLIITSLNFASLLWTVNTDGPVSTKPVLFEGSAIVSSQDGYVYY
ncbi:PQQ-binding-like beta-propeller repeat protein, partial [Candidatus Micrarchaeota archaeon]|nr:PQQ-binding-like beta-propeller repeat protein [Candidatus Micrarchaeota archaeon]